MARAGATYRFADCEIDERLYELRRGGELVKLEPKVFDVLGYLVRHRDRVVPKDELLAQLWPNEFVSESVLPRCITVARKAIGDDSTAQRLIQTVHGRGYRFIAPLQGETPSRNAATSRADDSDPARIFVGRTDAMRELEASLAAALRGDGRLVVIVGEPGIGKTRTAEELARRAIVAGAEVHTGRCYEGDGAPAFWPWTQVLRSVLTTEGAEHVAGELGDAAHPAVQLVSDLAASGSAPARIDTAADVLGGSNETRFRLFESVTTVLRRIARRAPIMIVLDDLHWADKPSLLLLQFLAREMRGAPILVVGTYRDVGLTRHHPLAEMLGDLARERLHHRVLLRGLERADVAQFVESAGGRSPAPSVVAAIYEMTEGNPFFIGEIVQLLLAGAGPERLTDDAPLTVPLPQGVREAIGRRLTALSPECNAVLTAASVIGRDVAVPVLERVSGVATDRLLELVDEAVAARILVAVPGAPARYAFAHTLVRETLYDELTTVQRVRVHRHVAAVLEELYGGHPGPRLAEIAHHFFQGAPGGDVDKAVAYAVRAGDHALELLAYEEAAGHYERALQALELAAPVDEVRRCDIMLRRGDACSRAGERDDARAIFLAVADAARRNARPDQLARAALGFGGHAEFGMPQDATLVALLKEARAGLGADDHVLRARVLSRLTGTAPYSESLETRAAFSLEAVELARRTGDPETLVMALDARCWALLGPDHVEERVALGSELVEIGTRTRSKTTAFLGHESRASALLALGDVGAVDAELATMERLANELRRPIERWFVVWFRAARALGDGRFGDAERLIADARLLGERARHPGAALIDNGLTLFLAHERGRSREFAERFEPFVEYFPWAARLLRLAAALSLTELGREEDARAEFEVLAAHEFQEIPRDEHWMSIMAQLAAICLDLGDTRRGAVLYELLEPFAERIAVHDLLHVYSGCVAHFLGLLASARGDQALAIDRLEQALAVHRRIGSRSFEARTQYEYARVLLARGRRNDTAKARELLRDSAASARAMGMERALDLAVRLGERCGAAAPAPRRSARK